ncbi:hypothetical protein RA28_16665 [Ruegeria sp. ANG-S4]|uniref:MFS transporter n=1 Tax=Ruegeria sp. ANG-S4 TaxID=1577904 RepID=UPI00057ED266|nr:MFS transporter [Ruegeria sp. ANG-S4]KIC44531.1 hypothetical protein RA28_16665 [Ruegeria sp. ANG-S4]
MSPSVRTFFQVILLWLAGLGAATQFAKIAVPFADVAIRYPDNAASIGWMLSIISFMGAVLGALSGALTGWVGPTRLLVWGLVLGGLISLFQALELSFPVMLASRLVEGISHLAIVVAAPTLIAQITTGRARNAAMVLWSTFFGVAFALNAWFGLTIVDRFGLSLYFALHGALMLLISGLVALLVVQVRSDDHGTFVIGCRGLVGVHVETYRSPFVAAPAFGWFFYTLTFVSLLAILPGRLPEEVSGTIAGLMPLAGIALSLLVVPLLLNVLSSVAVVNIGFALGVLVLLAAFAGLPLPIVGIALFAVLGFVQGGSFAAVPQLNTTAETQALGYGAIAQMGNAGNLLGTPVLLAILWRTGEAGMLTAVIGFYAAAIGVHLWLAQQRKVAA